MGAMTDDPAGDAPAAPREAEPPDEPPDTLETLANDLRGPMLGSPRQQVTGMVIIAIVLLGLLFGITALARDGAFDVDLGGPLFGRPSPSAGVVRVA
jgi:hypothetical protein